MAMTKRKEVTTETFLAKAVLDVREQKFVTAMLKHGQPEQAAIDAGYAKSVARTKAYLWVSDRQHKPHVYDAIHGRLEKAARKVDFDAVRVLNEMGYLALHNVGELVKVEHGVPMFDVERFTPAHWAAVKEISYEKFTVATGDKDANGKPVTIELTRPVFKFHAKHGPLQDLMRHFNLFPKEQSGVSINISLVELIMESYGQAPKTIEGKGE